MTATSRFVHVDKLLSRTGPFAAEGFEPSPSNKESLLATPVLVLGAGGLGCEILKCLALTGFTSIDVIDMDTIDVSNLNRQFLFRPNDVKKPKAVQAAAFIQQRVRGVTVTPHFCKMQDLPNDFYNKFKIIIAGLDSIDARRWINKRVCDMVLDDHGRPNIDKLVPIIDGGTEGFKGHARVIIPGVTACFECSLELFPPQTKYPLCTIADKPRLPEHCIEWANLAFPSKHPGVQLDTDEPEHLKWIFEAAKQRAEEHNIPGVTYQLVQGVVKNIIPAIASTNAVIAAACVNEAFKIATNAANCMNNYCMFMGGTGLYTHTFDYEKKPECPVCGNTPVDMVVSETMTLMDFVTKLVSDQRFHLKNPSIFNGDGAYILAHGPLAEDTKENLTKPLPELIPNGTKVIISDAAMPPDVYVNIIVSYLPVAMEEVPLPSA